MYGWYLHSSWEEELATAAEQPPSGAKPKILVADDNEMNALALEDYLTAGGYDLYFAADGEQALARAKEVGPDLILMDIQMPKISGVEAMRRLRANPRFAATPILALTALAMPGDRELCLAAGASAYIAKPFLLKDLVRTIREWLPAQ
jgi:CheY-like chemotaxis protein